MLTHRQRDVLKFIESEIARTGGVPPSYREIGAYLGSNSTGGARTIVLALEERGYLLVFPNRARAIKVLRSSKLRERWFVWDDESQKLVPASDNRRNVA